MENNFDETFTEKEIELIESLAEVSIKKNLLCTEEELFDSLNLKKIRSSLPRAFLL